MFDDFDFKILDDPLFKEDSVREEIVVPILKRLGYTATGDHKIIRSQPLEHPFVNIGTKKHKVNIYPDYQLAPSGKRAWVLDAKSPSEDVRAGTNVEQAYSYAIHRDVRVPLYGLCNGREIVIYHISELEPHLAMNVPDLDDRWNEVHEYLSPLAFTDPKAPDFLPDFGLAIHKSGNFTLETMYFPALEIHYIAKARDDLYTFVSNFDLGERYCASFDIEPALFNEFLEVILPRHKIIVERAMKQLPYSIETVNDSPVVTIGAEMGNYLVNREVDSYIPLKIVEIVKPKTTKA